ncbi:hypothetical protein [Amycolatopsis sp. cmx-4-61]|uniref:hypothetical protein n=1 Tax=Amycolatopsis sp. cmx-4-61 TaxID=2790937 RepID=UPI00397E48FE
MAAETYNPWTIVNLVFTHLAERGLHPALGADGHPGDPAAALLRAFGIVPTVEGDARVQAGIHDELAELRGRLLDTPSSSGSVSD